MIFCSVLFSLRFFPAFFCADKPEIQKNVIYAKSIVGRMYVRFFNRCMIYNLKLLFIRQISLRPNRQTCRNVIIFNLLEAAAKFLRNKIIYDNGKIELKKFLYALTKNIMKTKALFFTWFISCVLHAQTKTANREERLKIAGEMERSIKTELLNKWYPQSLDSLYGGFITTFTYDFKPTGPQDKFIVSQARHTWSTAKAAELYPRSEEH